VTVLLKEKRERKERGISQKYMEERLVDKKRYKYFLTKYICICLKYFEKSEGIFEKRKKFGNI